MSQKARMVRVNKALKAIGYKPINPYMFTDCYLIKDDYENLIVVEKFNLLASIINIAALPVNLVYVGVQDFCLKRYFSEITRTLIWKGSSRYDEFYEIYSKAVEGNVYK